MKSLGADVVIDYKTQDFEDVLRDYDLVLNSQDGKTLEKSLRVLKSGGKPILISGPPDPEFGKEVAAPGLLRLVMRLLSSGVRRKAQGLGVGYAFLLMKANRSQLREITRLIEAGAIRPVIDRVLPFASTNEALAYVEAGRARSRSDCRRCTSSHVRMNSTLYPWSPHCVRCCKSKSATVQIKWGSN